MKNNNCRFLNNSGGALLFAIITSFILSFTSVSLVMLTSNQYKMIDNEIKRKEAYFLLKAGVEYANYMIRTEQCSFPVQTFTLPENDKIKITVTKLNSDYSIKVSTEY